MGEPKRYLALDYGTRSGAAIAGIFDGKKLELDCMHRFPVDSTTMLGTRYWGFPSMIINAKIGLAAAAAKYGPRLSGVAVDSWGVDFGLLEKTGHLLANPVHHMDTRTLETMDKVNAGQPIRSVFQKTGIKAHRGGTLFQLHSMAAANSPLLDKAVTMLLMADLVSYFLSGIPVQEYTLATTTSMYDAESFDWSRDIILTARIPPVMVPEIIAPGSVVGPMLDEVAEECGLRETPVIAAASHSHAGAVAAVPASSGEDWIYIVSGYWNRVGVELAAPIINDASFAADFSNEGGVDGAIRFQKGIPGMMLVEECRRAWEIEDNAEIDRRALFAAAAKAAALKRIVNPDDPRFVEPGSVIEKLRGYLAETGQPAAESRGDIVRMCLDSLALSHRNAIDKITELTGKKYAVVHLVDEQSENPLIGQVIADACGLPVKAGPVEAKAVGNLLMQAVALGDVASLAQIREIVGNSFDIQVLQPTAERGKWDEAYGKFRKMK